MVQGYSNFDGRDRGRVSGMKDGSRHLDEAPCRTNTVANDLWELEQSLPLYGDFSPLHGYSRHASIRGAPVGLHGALLRLPVGLGVGLERTLHGARGKTGTILVRFLPCISSTGHGRMGHRPNKGARIKNEVYEMSATMTPSELSTELSSDPKTVRKFLRSITPREGQPGKGSRWAVPANKSQLTKLRKQFTEWDAAQKAARAERAQKAAEDAAAAVETNEVDETD